MDHKTLSRDTAVFIIGVMTIIISCLLGLGTVVILSTIAVLNIMILTSSEAIRKLMGYGLLIDILFGSAIAIMALGTLGGFQIAMVSGLLYTLVRVEITNAWGSLRLSVNGKTKFFDIIKEGFKWLKNKITGAEAKFIVEWTEHKAPGGFEATHTGEFINWAKSKFVFKNKFSYVMPALFVAAGAAFALFLAQLSLHVVAFIGIALVGITVWFLRPQLA